MARILKIKKFVIICTALLFFCGCSKKDDQQQSQSSTPSDSPTINESTTPPDQGDSGVDFAKVAAENKQKLMEMNKGKDIEPLSLDKLKSFLPAELPGMERKSASAERNQMMGINIARSEARYEGDDSATVDISIMDGGNLSGPMKMALTGWAMHQFERETDTSYEKTTKYSGYPAMEEYDRSNERGALRVFVAERFVVEAEGYQTTMEKIKQAVGKVDIKKLAALASD
jgi:hypothetical protein